MFIIDDLLLAPFKGWNFIMRTLLKVAEEQWTDDAPLKEELLALQVRLEDGEARGRQRIDVAGVVPGRPHTDRPQARLRLLELGQRFLQRLDATRKMFGPEIHCISLP